MARRELSDEEVAARAARFAEEVKAHKRIEDRFRSRAAQLKPALYKAIDEFIAQPRLSDGGWAPVTEDDIDELGGIIGTLIEMKASLDADGDQTIEFSLVNRCTHERLNFMPVPYEHKRLSAGCYENDEKLFEDALDAAELNFHMAMDRYRTMNDIRRMNRREKVRKNGP